MKTSKDLDDFILSFTDSNNSCSNATVIYFIRCQRNKTPTGKGNKRNVPCKLIANQLIDTFGYCCVHLFFKLATRIRAVYDTFTSLSKHVDRNWNSILSFLKADFAFPHSHPLDATHSSPQRSDNGPSSQTETGHDISFNLNVRCDTPTKTVLTPSKTRRDCDNCSSAKKANVSLNENLKEKKGRLFQLKRSAAALKKEWGLKSKNQKLKRCEDKINSLKRDIKKNKIKMSRLLKRNSTLTDMLDGLTKDNSRLRLDNDKLMTELHSLTTIVRRKQEKIDDLGRHSDYLVSIVEELKCRPSQNMIAAKTGKMYTFDLRRCIYHHLIRDVPVNSCGPLIQLVLKCLGGKYLDSVPCRSTCCQMAYELGVISTIQLMEFILENSHICLSWDATTIDGAHVNEIHLTVNKVECLVLDVRHLSGGTTADYVAHIMSALTDAAATYARFSGQSETHILSSLLSSISSTLTDRAAVNAAVTRQLCHELEADLLQLNCNVHPLDSIAREVKKDLVKFDAQHDIQGHCFGTEGAAANLIKAVSVLRHKDGKGDPAGFMNFLRQHDIPLGAFTRYVGNRLHVLFHLAGLVIVHAAKLKDFVDKECTAAGLLRSKLSKDLHNSRIIVEVWALAIVGKTITGPWMTKFYSSTWSNLDMGPLIRDCVARLQAWLDSPGQLLDVNVNVFGEKLSPCDDEVVSALHSFDTDLLNLQQEVLVSVLSSTLSVLKRQLNDFICGRFVSPSDTMISSAANAPCHNMASERALGSLDRMWRRAPNATLGFLNGKVRSKLNKTMEWLEGKSVSERESLILFSIKEAQSDRAQKTIHQKTVCADITTRRKDVSDQRKKAQKNLVVRTLKASFLQCKTDNIMHYSEDVVARISSYITSPDSVIGSLVLCDNGVQKYARIQRLKRNNVFVVSYWSLDQPECTSCDFTVSAASFYADVVLGQIVFL